MTTGEDQTYNFLRVVDVSNPARFEPSDDGFDLDAVKVLSD